MSNISSLKRAFSHFSPSLHFRLFTSPKTFSHTQAFASKMHLWRRQFYRSDSRACNKIENVCFSSRQCRLHFWRFPVRKSVIRLVFPRGIVRYWLTYAFTAAWPFPFDSVFARIGKEFHFFISPLIRETIRHQRFFRFNLWIHLDSKWTRFLLFKFLH